MFGFGVIVHLWLGNEVSIDRWNFGRKVERKATMTGFNAKQKARMKKTNGG